MKRLYHIVLLVLISSSYLQASSFSAVIQNPSPDLHRQGSEFGITQYPLAVQLLEATKRLNEIKPDAWLLSKVVQTDSHIEDVTNYFKKQAVVRNKIADSKSVQWLMWNNWNIKSYKFSELPPVFGLDAKLIASSSEEVKATFGVIVLSDSLVRINLLSPYPTEDNQKFKSGTMFSIISEPLPEATLGDEDQKKPDSEKVYSAKEVDQKVSIWSKPSAVMPEPWGESIVSLRVVFSSTGKVKDIELIVGPMDRFARAAIAAARKIKFAPALKDGRYVSQVGLLEYRFGISEVPQVQLPVPRNQLPTRRKPD